MEKSDDTVQINTSLPNSTKSVASESISIDDIEEVKSKKWRPTGNINKGDNTFDKEMNEAFGDEPLV